MPYSANDIKSVFNLTALYLPALLAHHVAGGSFASIQSLFLQIILITVVLVAIKDLALEGPTLAFAVLASQSSSHFILGGAEKTSEFKMSFSHLMCGTLTFLCISRFDSAWNFLDRLVAYFKPSVLVLCEIENSSFNVPPNRPHYIAESLKALSANPFRAPPADAVYLNAA